ncbi:BTAD domain-containing putative transcriptional regulator [Streptomyces sp. DSM 116496]|uniref:AfsR/SARP family transcriptional regulator n=1 Tax=Streptomyces stoeckheimensis TaxID=3344656 RepID=UPI0038B26BD9
MEVWRTSQRLPLGGRKPRALLATLALHGGRVVSAQTLIDAVWGERPPDTVRTLLQTYVWLLRRELGDVIETRAPGYLLRVEEGQVDRDVFADHVARGRQAASNGSHDVAAREFRTALDLWRGPALGGIGDALQATAAHLDQERLTVLDERIAAESAQGLDLDIAELAALVADHPTRERTRGALILALYRVGRQAEALEVYQDGRRVLAEELGIDPGPELRRLHEAVLRGDPALLAAPRDPALTPAQLPPTAPDFTGRVEALDALAAALTGARTAVAVCVVSGAGGVGKSTLAAEAAHQVADAYPDGQLYADLRGVTESPATPGEILGRFLRALGQEVPEVVAERVDLFRTVLTGRRILMVLDDAGTEQQVRPLLPGSPSCGVLITSRNRLPGLAGTTRTELEVFDTAAALDLLARIAGPDRIAAEPEAARRIVALCGQLPLAVRIAGARLATRRHWTTATLADRLSDERRRLDELAVGDLEVRASVALSYQVLNPAARRAFRLIGLLGAADFAPWVVAALLDTDDRTADDAVEALIDAQLLGVTGVGRPRFRLHELLRVYALERAEAEDTPADLSAALSRALGSWLWLIRRQAPSGEVEPGADFTTARPVRSLPDPPNDWFEQEAPVLVLAVEHAAAIDLDVAACEVSVALSSSSFGVRNRFEEWWRTHTAALAAARRAGNRTGEAMVLSGLGQLRYAEDRFDQAHEYFASAFGLFAAAGDLRGQAVSRAGAGSAYREQGRFSAARDALDEAVAGFRTVGDDAGLGYAGRLAGSVHLEQGRYADALYALDGARAAYRRLGSRRGEALTLRTTGLVRRAMGEYGAAEMLLEQSLEMLRSLGDQLMIAYADQALAKTRIRLGTAERAPLEDALLVCRAHHDRLGEGLVLRTIGEFHLAAGELGPAEACLTAAGEVWDALELPLFGARTLRDLAAVYTAAGDRARADAVRARALAVFAEFGAREYTELSGLHAASGDLEGT